MVKAIILDIPKIASYKHIIISKILSISDKLLIGLSKPMTFLRSCPYKINEIKTFLPIIIYLFKLIFIYLSKLIFIYFIYIINY